jgi:predicted enzyme related to lactoylglutathione lyase
MSRVVHFEIPADNPERAMKFYSRIFDWKIEKWAGPMDYWLVTTGTKEIPGIDGAIMPRGQNSCVIDTIDVPSVDEYIDKITANGGSIVQPKTAIPGMGYLAYFRDTEGNTLGIYQTDMSVK